MGWDDFGVSSSQVTRLLAILMVIIRPLRWWAVGIWLTTALSATDASQPVDPLLLLDGARAGDRLIVVGERGHILLSDDEADSWRQADTPTDALLTAIHMHDHHVGWAVGHDAVILRTSTGGETWERVHYAPEEERPLLDVWFMDAHYGFAVGAYGFLLVTTDGGDVWEPRSVSEDDYHLNVLAPATDNRLYIGAEAGITYRSEDGGLSWQRLSTPYHGSWFGAVALTPDTVLVAGLRGHLFRSADGGVTWEEVLTQTTAGLTSLQRLPSGEVLVTGLEGVLLEGVKDGRQFSLTRQPDRLGITGALVLEDGDLLLIGEFGTRRIARTQ